MAIAPKPKLRDDSSESVDYSDYDFTLPIDDADIILVSGDKVPSEAKVYYAHRAVLAAGSPFFRDLFGLPQPVVAESAEEGALPRIQMTEPHVVLSLLLRLVYPIPKPQLSRKTLPVPMLSEVLGAAVKYDLTFPLAYLRALVVSPGAGYLEEDATRVYAVACRHGMEREAGEAMRWAVKKGVDVGSMPLEEEWRWVSAWEYRRLETWTRERRRAVVLLVREWYSAAAEAEQPGTRPPKCVQCNGSPFTAKDEPKWWTEYMRRVGDGWLGTERMFEMDFLADVVNESGCPRCAASVLGARGFLDGLRRAVAGVVAAI
ncbi:hypothetical protein APHAL10511_001550 [Amanita phalloides]|nr:hypothetical protein APHAL10511_001550 [Amanita phalloides]